MSLVLRFNSKYTIGRKFEIEKELKDQGIDVELISDYESILKDSADDILQAKESCVISNMSDETYDKFISKIANEANKLKSIIDENIEAEMIQDAIKYQLEIETSHILKNIDSFPKRKSLMTQILRELFSITKLPDDELKNDFYIWPKGTTQKEIVRWFAKNHSKIINKKITINR